MRSWIEEEMEHYEANYGWDSEEERETHFRKLYETAVSYMDDEIREELHAEWDETKGGEMEFMKAYEERHHEKYGEEFMIN